MNQTPPESGSSKICFDGASQQSTIEPEIAETSKKTSFQFTPEFVQEKLGGRTGQQLTEEDIAIIIAANNDGGSNTATWVKAEAATIIGGLVAKIDGGIVGKGKQIIVDAIPDEKLGKIFKKGVEFGLSYIPDKPVSTILGYAAKDVDKPVPHSAAIIIDNNEIMSDLTGRYDPVLNAYIFPASMIEAVKKMNPDLNDQQAQRACVSLHEYANSEKGSWLSTVMSYISEKVSAAVTTITDAPTEVMSFIKSKIGWDTEQEPRGEIDLSGGMALEAAV